MIGGMLVVDLSVPSLLLTEAMAASTKIAPVIPMATGALTPADGAALPVETVEAGATVGIIGALGLVIGAAGGGALMTGAGTALASTTGGTLSPLPYLGTQ